MSRWHPDFLPERLRRFGRAILSQPMRARLAATLQDVANLQYRLGPAHNANRKLLTELKDSRAGRTCVIIGNGPSMAGFDVARLDGFDAFCLNRGYLLWAGTGRRPRCLVVINPLVLEQFGAELAAVEALRFVPWEHRGSFPGKDNAFIAVGWRPRFSCDLRTGIWGGGTVTFAAMQIAYHLGYRRVVLIGVDHAFDFSGEPNETLTADGPDGNHFSSDYFSDGAAWHAPDLALSEKAYAMARDAFVADGREIVNAGEQTRLRVFPSMALEQALADGTERDASR